MKEQIKQMSFKEWEAEGERKFGKDKKKWKFKCVNCGHIQSIQDFIDLKVEEPENYVYFTCIGRFMENCKGILGNKKSPCNYTLGGLFNLAKLEVIDEEGKKHSAFEFANEEK